MSRKGEYYYALDLIRFGAAAGVCLFHIGFYDWASMGSTTSRMFAHAASFPALTPWTWAGWMGVEVFFVLSGLVIAQSANGATPFAFLKSRILRLLPAAWICASLTLLAVTLIAGTPLRDTIAPYLRALALWPEGPWIDGAYWSLGVEVVFYAVIFMLLATRRFSMLPWLAWGLTAASSLFLTVSLLQLRGVIPDNRLLQFATAHAESLLLRYGVFFAVGIWLWFASRRQMTPARWAGLALAVGFGGLEVWLRAYSMEVFEAPAARGQPVLGLVVFWLLAPLAILVVTRWPEVFTPHSAAMRNGLRTLGRATYPLYLVQNVIGVGIARELVLWGMAPYAAVAAAIACVVLLGLVIAILPEVQVRRALSRLLDRAERLLPKAVLSIRTDPI